MVGFRECLRAVCCAVLVILPSVGLWAEVGDVPPPPEVGAKAHILIDPNNNQVLTQDNVDQHLAPASLTKLMTAYTVFKELRAGRITLDSEVRISRRAWRMDGSKMFINKGTDVTVGDLLKGLIIQSGNDAAVALAEFSAGSVESFADLMNSNAKDLGLADSHFVNPTGLPTRDHYSSARDLALLTTVLIQEFPEYYYYFSELEFSYQPPGETPIAQPNRNKLLRWDSSVDGVKTGYTEEAGYCLAASARRDGMRLISVILGAETGKQRFKSSQALLNWGFDFFENLPMFTAGRSLEQVRVWKGNLERVDLGTLNDAHVTVPRGRFDQLQIETEISGEPVAPVGKNRILGMVAVTLDGETLLERPLVTLQGVGQGSLWHRIVDAVRLWAQ